MGRDITKLHPRLQTMIVRLKELCELNGLKIGIGDAFRTTEEQNALYAQGRTTLGNIITNAKGTTYSSAHQWGIAFDFYRDDGTGAYNDSDDFFTKVGNLGQSIGLEWGGTWTSFVDKTHFQLPDWGSTPFKLKEMYGTPEQFIETWTTKTTPTVIGNEGKGSGYMFEPLTVKEGSRGTSVLLLQEILKARDFKGHDGKDLALDGICGVNTVYAINAYQSARRSGGKEIGTNGQNDSICGKKMWADLIAI